jgi:4'-phosphopantetheinyl transferase
VNPGEIHVWRVCLETAQALPSTSGEAARAARFRTPEQQRRYLRSHAALRAVLARETDSRLDFAVSEHGKPYLAAAPDLKFNLAHSGEKALVAVAREVEIGVDVERLRPMPDYREIADRFFPEPEAAEVASEADFFRRWTRLEAAVKALGVGVYGLGIGLEGEWTIEGVDAGPGYAAAVAAPRSGMLVQVHDFE